VSEHKAQFQVYRGSEWVTIVEADIIDGEAQVSVEWAGIEGLEKRITYTGSMPIEITTVTSSSRDTHFAGFAQALMHELFVETEPHNWSELIAQAEPIIARRVYDLMMHALTILDRPEYIDDIPDLAELPKEETEK
jgi:hypothetical protein